MLLLYLIFIVTVAINVTAILLSKVTVTVNVTTIPDYYCHGYY